MWARTTILARMRIPLRILSLSPGEYEDIGRTGGPEVYGEDGKLDELLPDHPGKVVECFARLTDNIDYDTFVIQTEPAKRILKIGLESTEGEVRRNAERVQENLLRRSMSDLLNLGDRWPKMDRPTPATSRCQGRTPQRADPCTSWMLPGCSSPQPDVP